MKGDATSEMLIDRCIEYCGEARAWDSVIKLKWISAASVSCQMTTDEIIAEAARETMRNI